MRYRCIKQFGSIDDDVIVGKVYEVTFDYIIVPGSSTSELSSINRHWVSEIGDTFEGWSVSQKELEEMFVILREDNLNKILN